jgi:hypothetical protein
MGVGARESAVIKANRSEDVAILFVAMSFAVMIFVV